MELQGMISGEIKNMPLTFGGAPEVKIPKAHGVKVDGILIAKCNNYLFVASKAKFTVSRIKNVCRVAEQRNHLLYTPK
jgi:hypothetical protein